MPLMMICSNPHRSHESPISSPFSVIEVGIGSGGGFGRFGLYPPLGSTGIPGVIVVIESGVWGITGLSALERGLYMRTMTRPTMIRMRNRIHLRLPVFAWYLPVVSTYLNEMQSFIPNHSEAAPPFHRPDLSDLAIN